MIRFPTTRACALLIAGAISCALTAPASAECKLYGGIGNGFTEGIAKFMA
jgi:hypothetical protein